MTMMTRKGKARLKSSQTSMVLMAAVGGRLDDMNEGERHYGFRNKFREKPGTKNVHEEKATWLRWRGRWR